MPFGNYKDFADCVSKNSDKEDAKAYCASIQKQSESKTVEMNGKKYKVVEENASFKIMASIKKTETVVDNGKNA